MAYRKPTGQLLKSLRPETYRKVVELLSEPRNHVSYSEIARICSVGGHTIKAIERAESETLADRKRQLMDQSWRVAKRALNRLEDGIDTAPVAVAVPVYGVCVEKALLLAGEPTSCVEVKLEASDLYAEFQALTEQITQALSGNKAKALPEPGVIEAEVVS